jgi:hypothetical protein
MSRVKPIAAMTSSPVRSSAPKRVLDIEKALSWAYREELPKRERRLAFENAIDGPRLQPSPLARTLALATPIDCWSGGPDLRGDSEDADPDALAIEAAVHQLGAADLALDPSEYAGELIGLVPDPGQYGQAALSRIMEAVRVSAKLGARPPVPDAPRPRPPRSPINGRIILSSGTGTGAKAIRKNVYRTEVHCELRWFPKPASVVSERAAYLAWWLALEWLAGELQGLDSLIISAPSVMLE